MAVLAPFQLANVAAPFSPTDLSGLSLWLKANAGVTLSGSNVTAWTDQSGNGNNASVNNGAPLFENNVINNNPAIFFDGASTLITEEFLPIIKTTPITMFAVIKANRDSVRQNGDDARWLMNVTDNGDYIFGFNFGPYGGSPITASLMAGDSYDFEDVIQDSQQFGKPEVALCCGTNNGTTITFYKNGSSKGILATSPYSSSSNYGSFGIGAQITPNEGNPIIQAVCYVAEVIIYNRSITTSERQQVESYLNTKYAIY